MNTLQLPTSNAEDAAIMPVRYRGYTEPGHRPMVVISTHGVSIKIIKRDRES